MSTTDLPSRDEPDIPELPQALSRTTLRHFPLSMVLSDAREEDQPIIYVNAAFTRVTGYEAAYAVGRNCRFLQGEKTRPEDRAMVREALRKGEEITLDILNYRADGTSFINRLMITPLRDDDTGEVLYFLGVQTERSNYTKSYEDRADEADARLSELQHRIKNHLSMVVAMVRLEAQDRPDLKRFTDIIAARVETLSLLYDEFATGVGAGAGREVIGLGAYLSRVASGVHDMSGRNTIRLNLAVDAMPGTLELGSQLGLFLSEVMTNAYQHAFRPGEAGAIKVSLTREGREGVLRIEDDGRGTPPGAWPSQTSLGGRIVLGLVQSLDGSLSVDRPGQGDPERPGTRVTLRFAPSD